MVVDANVWVSAFIKTDVKHERSEEWRRARLRVRLPLALPILVLAEVGGAVGRRTGSPLVANGLVLSLSADEDIEFHSLDRDLGHRAADVATRLRLRGADAIYVALAADLDLPLVTWDDEILTRAAGIVDVRTPDQIPI